MFCDHGVLKRAINNYKISKLKFKEILKFKVETWQLRAFQDFLFDEFVKFINLSHLNVSMQIFHTVSYTFYCAENENLFNNQGLLQLVIIFLILATLM